jgi:hypothetical protein
MNNTQKRWALLIDAKLYCTETAADPLELLGRYAGLYTDTRLFGTTKTGLVVTATDPRGVRRAIEVREVTA